MMYISAILAWALFVYVCSMIEAARNKSRTELLCSFMAMPNVECWRSDHKHTCYVLLPNKQYIMIEGDTMFEAVSNGYDIYMESINNQ